MNDYTILENLFKDEQDENHFDLFKESNVIKINNNNGDNNNFDNGISFNTQSIASKMINYKDAYVLLHIECEIPFDSSDQGKKSIPKLLYLKNFDNGISFNTQSIASKMINYKDAYVLLHIECEIPFDSSDQGKKSIPKLLYLKNSFEIVKNQT